MNPPRVVAVGEVLWDLLPGGAVLGGAPANFAFQARALGAEVSLISRVGADELGRKILQRCAAAGLPLETMQVDAAAPTGTVSVELSGDGQPRYIIHERVAWDALVVDAAARAAVARADAICFGSLAQRASPARETIRELVAAAPPAALRVFDINLRQSFHSRALIEESLRLADVLKLNDAELPVLAAWFGGTGDARAQLAALAAAWDLTTVALTRGAHGALLFSAGHFSEHAGEAPPVIRDTIGAGDAFTAVLTLGLLARWPLDAINERANTVAAYVCSQAGATPELPPALRGFWPR